jgi:acyl-CoA synthetase (AMP-forming)/AMP-acid ligase II
MMRALVDEQERQPRSIESLRLFGYGAAPASSTLLRRFHNRFPDVELVSMYGATELSPMATAVNHAERFVDDDTRARTAGRPLVGVDVRVVDESGVECPPGVIGGVVARGPNVMAGYWNKPEATTLALRNGWYHSGDLGHLDDEALLYLVDRKKDMVITGGENVYSTEVEDVVARHPGVAECAVFTVPDDEWGEGVAVAVVARAGMHVVEADLRARRRAVLAGYKVPRFVVVFDELPRSAAGKILKRDLRAPFWNGRDRAIN